MAVPLDTIVGKPNSMPNGRPIASTGPAQDGRAGYRSLLHACSTFLASYVTPTQTFTSTATEVTVSTSTVGETSTSTVYTSRLQARGLAGHKRILARSETNGPAPVPTSSSLLDTAIPGVRPSLTETTTVVKTVAPPKMVVEEAQISAVYSAARAAAYSAAETKLRVTNLLETTGSPRATAGAKPTTLSTLGAADAALVAEAYSAANSAAWVAACTQLGVRGAGLDPHTVPSTSTITVPATATTAAQETQVIEYPARFHLQAVTEGHGGLNGVYLTNQQSWLQFRNDTGPFVFSLHGREGRLGTGGGGEAFQSLSEEEAGKNKWDVFANGHIAGVQGNMKISYPLCHFEGLSFKCVGEDDYRRYMQVCGPSNVLSIAPFLQAGCIAVALAWTAA